MDMLSLLFHPVSEAVLCKTAQESGLTLSPAQAHMLLASQRETLERLGRVDFSGGILPKLLRVFASSPYVFADNQTQTLAELTESFYFFKSETCDKLPDDDLLFAMARLFNSKCGGSVELLNDCTADDLLSACAGEERGIYDD